jgi:hypothetical protein
MQNKVRILAMIKDEENATAFSTLEFTTGSPNGNMINTNVE